MALPTIIKTFFSNFKIIVVGALIGAVIVGGVGLYYHGKRVEGLEGKIKSLEAEARAEQRVRKIVNEASEQSQEQRQNIDKAKEEAVNELNKAQREDKAVAEYLSEPVPDRVRDIRREARCLSLPYTCRDDGSQQDQSNGNEDK